MESESYLADLFRKEMNKSKDPRMIREAEFDVGYPTGYLAFDFSNGMKIKVEIKEENKIFFYNSIGITDGSMISVVGRSGCGKTTLVKQWAGNIVKPFPNAMIMDEELEAGSSAQKKRQLMNMTEEEFAKKYVPRNQGITTENFFARIKALHDLKINNRDIYEYDTGYYDPSGNRIYKLQPSVVILDSLAMLMPEDLTSEGKDGGEIAGSMAITSVAKVNTQLVKRVIPMLKAANILWFVINHILPDPSPVPKKAQVAWLKIGERCPGGETAIYLANNFIRVNDSSKLSAEKDLGINGINVELELVKSRTNRPGITVPMILDYDKGFNKELSLYALLKKHNRINGAGAYLYIGEHSEHKFSQKKIMEKLQEPEFAQIFMDEVFDVLELLINTSTIVTEDVDTEPKVDITSMMLQSMQEKLSMCA